MQDVMEKPASQKEQRQIPGSNLEAQKQAPKIIGTISTKQKELAKKIPTSELIQSITASKKDTKEFVQKNKKSPEEAAKRTELAAEIRQIRDNNRPGVIELKKQELEAINNAKSSMKNENNSVNQVKENLENKNSQISEFQRLKLNLDKLQGINRQASQGGVGGNLLERTGRKIKQTYNGFINREEIKGKKLEIESHEKVVGKNQSTLESEIRQMEMAIPKFEEIKERNNQRLQEDQNYVENVKVGDPKALLEKYYTGKKNEMELKERNLANNQSVETMLNSIPVSIKKVESQYQKEGFIINIGDFLPITFKEGHKNILNNASVVNKFWDETRDSSYINNSAVTHFEPLGFSENVGKDKSKEVLLILLLGIKKIINLNQQNPSLFKNVEKFIGFTNDIFASNLKTLGFKETFKINAQKPENGKNENIGVEVNLQDFIKNEKKIDKLINKLSKSFIGSNSFTISKNSNK